MLLTVHDAISNYVAVEKGSDIRVAKKIDNTCIEVKFYKDKQFTRNHSSIRHTIYNFYNSFLELQKNNQQIPQFVYRTNVTVADNDKTFFKQWSNIPTPCENEYIEYIKDCIVHESVQIKPYSDAFDKFKADNKDNINKENPKSADYLKLLISELHADTTKYNTYSDVVPRADYMTFIKRINYEFADEHKSKDFVLEQTRTEITHALKQYNRNLQETDCEKIRNWVIEEFFDTDRIEAISVSDLQGKINNHQQIQVRYIHDSMLKKYIMTHDSLIQSFSKDIDNNGFSSDKQTLLCCYVAFLEKFYSEAANTSLDEMCSKYVLDTFEYQPFLIGDLFRSMSILATMAHVDSKGVILSNLNGINNFWLSEDHSYCLKGTDNRHIENDFKSLIHSFISQVKSRGYIDRIEEATKIVFRTDCKPCELDLDLEQTIMDITQVDANIKDQILFSSLDYKCSRCLDLKVDDTQNHVDCFIGGNCYGRDTK